MLSGFELYPRWVPLLIYYIHYISHPLCHAYADDIQFYVQFKPENPIDESKTVDA